ncbi:MAG TPA: protoporphyrinogen oxidase [Coriobacteriia bacterium]|nr:protoporphyrinogen oxidase [Coriobacteriia bacterium]
MTRVVIVGGGVAGLGAAYKIRRAADAGHDVEFLLVEKDDRLGGKLWTDLGHDSEGNTYVADGGSDSFLTEKPAIHRVAKLLGIFEEETGTRDELKKTFIVKNGKLVEMPDGMMMFAPTKLMPLATSKLYSWPAKFRMAMDLVLPRKTVWAEGESAQQHDETLESLVVRRLGREALDRLAEPLSAGVNGDNAEEMSVAARYPMLLDMEQKYGSLVKGFLAQRKKVEEMRKKYPPKPGQPRKTFFSSFKPGLQYLTDKMAEGAGLAHIRTGVAATAVARADDGWRVTLSDGSVETCDAVVLASEVWAAANLARGFDAELADLLATIPCSSCATVLLAYNEADCPFPKDWHGILTPSVEKSPVGGVSLMSSKWPERAPEGKVLLRVFVGGPRDQTTLKKSDDELIEVAHEGLVKLLGLPADAKRLYAKTFRWELGMPQYTLGHLDRVDLIEAKVAGIGGLGIAGNAYRGVGVPNALESGEQAVSKVLADLGIELAEDKVEEKRLY